MKKTYNSKIDEWLIVLLLALFGGISYSVYSEFSEGRTDSALVMSGVTLLLFVSIFLFGYPCRYTLEDDHLLVRSGVMRRKFFYKDMTGVAPSSSFLSSPALSLKRIKISMRRGFVLISPPNREEFISELEKRRDAARP